MISSPLVTIGIPFFNAQSYLAFAIQSVISQSYTNWELILVDDGSTDQSLSIAKSFSDSRIRLLSDGLHLGLPIRLNQITSLARGFYVARMDADDIMFQDRIAQQVIYFVEHPEVDVLGTGYCLVSTRNSILQLSITREQPDWGNAIFSGEFIAHPTVMARRDWYLKNPYSKSYPRAEDRVLWVESRKQTVFRNIPKPLLFYRVYELDVKKYVATNKSLIKFYCHSLCNSSVPLLRSFLNLFLFITKTVLYLVANSFGSTFFIKRLSCQSIDASQVDELEKQLHLQAYEVKL
jgi:glycosyltransferase involved in cell wall biosynthesis